MSLEERILALERKLLDPDVRASSLELDRLIADDFVEFGSLLALTYIPCYYVIVIRSFENTGTEDIFDGKNTKAARRTCPHSLWKKAARKLDLLDSVVSLDELRIPPGNRLETLAGDRRGQHSIRINDQYRICFVWTDTGPDEVEIVDYH